MSVIKWSLAGCGCFALAAVILLALFGTLSAGNRNNSAEPPPQVQDGSLDSAQQNASDGSSDTTTANGEAPPAQQGYNGTCGEKIVAFARAQIGKPYVMGAVGPNAFDCQGLVYAAAHVAGITAPNGADYQPNPKLYSGGTGRPYWPIGPIGIEPGPPRLGLGQCPGGTNYRNLGYKKLDTNKLKPGDFVFFGDKDPTQDGSSLQGCNGVHHVGIYSGNGKMIEAPNSRAVVREVPLAGRAASFYGAIRVCNDGGSDQTTALDDFRIDQSKMISGAALTRYKRYITAYAKNHYGINTWQLTPGWIVMHTTETSGFPGAFLSAPNGTLAGERPGAISQYVLEEETVYQLLPDGVMSRSVFGLNHAAYNLEIVGAAARRLPDKTIHKAAQWAIYISKQTGVPIGNVISHRDVSEASFNRGRADLVSAYRDQENYAGDTRTDPGPTNMQAILAEINRLQTK